MRVFRALGVYVFGVVVYVRRLGGCTGTGSYAILHLTPFRGTLDLGGLIMARLIDPHSTHPISTDDLQAVAGEIYEQIKDGVDWLALRGSDAESVLDVAGNDPHRLDMLRSILDDIGHNGAVAFSDVEQAIYDGPGITYTDDQLDYLKSKSDRIGRFDEELAEGATSLDSAVNLAHEGEALELAREVWPLLVDLADERYYDREE